MTCDQELDQVVRRQHNLTLTTIPLYSHQPPDCLLKSFPLHHPCLVKRLSSPHVRHRHCYISSGHSPQQLQPSTIHTWLFHQLKAGVGASLLLSVSTLIKIAVVVFCREGDLKEGYDGGGKQGREVMRAVGNRTSGDVDEAESRNFSFTTSRSMRRCL